MTTLAGSMTSGRQFLRCHDSRDASRGVMFALPASDSMIPRKPTLEELALSPIPDGLKCGVCHKVYKEPVIALSCGHFSCKACAFMKDSKSVQCPTCFKVSPASSPFGVAVNKQFDDVKVRCLNGVSFDLAEGKFTAGGWIGGCQEVMVFGEQEAHLLQCVKMPVRCRFESLGCALVRGRGKIAEHEAICPFRREKCRCGSCGSLVEGHSMEEHRAGCYAVDVECPNSIFGCSFVVSRGGLAPHVKVCPFAQVRPYFERQEEESKGLRTRVALLEERTGKLVRNLEERNGELISFKTSYTSLEEETRRLRGRILEQNNQLAKLSAEVEERNGKLYGQSEQLFLREEQLEQERSLSRKRGATCLALEAEVKALNVKVEELEKAEMSNVEEEGLEADVKMLRARVTELEEGNAALEKRVVDMSSQNANLMIERAKVDRLEIEAQKLRQRVALLLQQNLELEKERLGESDTRRIGGPQTPHGELERTSAREPERWQEELQHAGMMCPEKGADLIGGTNGSSKSSPLMEGCIDEEVHEVEGVHDSYDEGGHADLESGGRVEDHKDTSPAAANGTRSECNTGEPSPSDAELDSGGLGVVMEGLMQLASGNWRTDGSHAVPAPPSVNEDDSSQLRGRIKELEEQLSRLESQAQGERQGSRNAEAQHTKECSHRTENTEAELEFLRKRVKELEMQNAQQAQQVNDLVDQNARLAPGNAKLSVVEREAKGLRERLEELEKQIKEMVAGEAGAKREEGDLPRVPDWVEERVNRLVGGLPALESSDRDEEAFRPRLAELARQNIELASQEVELKKQVHFLAERCSKLEGVEDEVVRLRKQVAELEKINHNLFQRNASLEGLWADAREKALMAEKGWRDHRARGTRASSRRQKAEVKVEVDVEPSKVEKEEETAGLNKLCAALQTSSSQGEGEEETAGLNQLCAVLQLADDEAGNAACARPESVKASEKEEKDVELVAPEPKEEDAKKVGPVTTPRKRKASTEQEPMEEKAQEGSQPKVKKQKESEKKNEQANGLSSAVLMTWGGVGESVKRRHAAPPVPAPAPASSKSVPSKLPASESKSGSSKQASSDAKNSLSIAAEFAQVLGPAYGGVGEAVKKRHARPPPGVVNSVATNGKSSPVKRPAPVPTRAASGPSESDEKRRKKRKMVNSLVDKDKENEKEKQREKEREEREKEREEKEEMDSDKSQDAGKLIIPEKGKRTPKEGVKENERCIRSDGRDWRCHRRRMDAEHQFCETHYLQHKAKIERKQAKRVSVEVKKSATKPANRATASKGATGNISKGGKVISKSKKMKDDEKPEGPSRQCAYTGGHMTWRCSKPAEFGMTHCKKHMAQGGKAIPWLAAAPAHKSGVKG